MPKRPLYTPEEAGVPESARECIEAYRSTGSLTDLQGSYTGFFREKGRMSFPPHISHGMSVADFDDCYDMYPVQDADDL